MQLRNPFSEHGFMTGMKARAEIYGRHYGLDQCLRRCLNSASSEAVEPLPAQLVAELYAHWGDPLTDSGENYLRSCLAEARRARSHVFQCGASLLTLLLGALCAQAGSSEKQLWSLEHDSHWANLIRSWLTQYEVNATHVISARAELFQRYVWYAIDPANLPRQFSLVICEGGRATPQGVAGTLDKLGDRLAPDAVILARKIGGAANLRALSDWARNHDASCVLVDKREGFVKLARRPAQAAAAT